jgi:hypothetical protein
MGVAVFRTSAFRILVFWDCDFSPQEFKTLGILEFRDFDV